MKLTNLQIYNYIQSLNTAFADSKQYLPIKLNFAIQKNAKVLSALAQEIEKSRLDIFRHYGELDEVGNLKVSEDNKEEAIKEINSLFEIEQEVNILTINLDSVGETSLSLEQMNAIMFMIEED